MAAAELSVGPVCYVTSDTTGTGNLTLDTATGWNDPNSEFGTGTGAQFFYSIRNPDATEWEEGIGYLSGTATMVRQTVLRSSNSDALVSFTAGTKEVVVDVPSGMQAGFEARLLHFRDEKSSGSGGGTFTAGGWRTRDINVEVTNEIDGASVGTNLFTLPAGKYHLSASAPAYRVNGHKTRLYNATDTAEVFKGTSEYSSSTAGGNSHSRSLLVGIFTITASKNFEIQHYCSSTYATYGQGSVIATDGNETFCEGRVWRIGDA